MKQFTDFCCFFLWHSNQVSCQVWESNTAITVWPLELKLLTPTIQGGYSLPVACSGIHTDIHLKTESYLPYGNCGSLRWCCQCGFYGLHLGFLESSGTWVLNSKGTEGRSWPPCPSCLCAAPAEAVVQKNLQSHVHEAHTHLRGIYISYQRYCRVINRSLLNACPCAHFTIGACKTGVVSSSICGSPLVKGR